MKSSKHSLDFGDFKGKDETVYDLDFYVDKKKGSCRVEDTLLNKIGDKKVLSQEKRNRLNTLS